MGSATQNWSTKQVEIVCGQGPCNIQDPESKIENPKNTIQNPNPKIPNPKFQNTKFQKIQILVLSIFEPIFKGTPVPHSERDMDMGDIRSKFLQRQCCEQNTEHPEGLKWFKGLGSKMIPWPF